MPAPKGNQNALGNKGGGRTPEYKPEYAALGRKFCLLGATDEDLARMFEVSLSAIEKWKRTYVEFSKALKDGKEKADAEIADALFHRAKGYTHKAVKIYADPKTGAVVKVPYRERYPPDTAAASLWLRNRAPDLWRDRQHVVVEDPDKVLARVLGVEPDALPPPEAASEVAAAQVVNEAEAASEAGDAAGVTADLDLDKHQG